MDERALILAGGVLAVLVVASLVGARLKRAVANGAPHAAIDNLNARVRAWWVIALVFGAALAAGRAGVIALFAGASWVALREYTQAAARGADTRLATALSTAIVAAQYGFIWQGASVMFACFVPGCALAAWLIGALRPQHRHRVQPSPWGLLLCVYGVSHAAALLAPGIAGRGADGAYLLVFLVVVVQASDVLQYLWGKLAGRHPIAPRWSPSKTVEGTLGGIASAVALGTALAPITPFGALQAAALSAAITTLGFAGGMTLSAVKRRRGIKDWGRFIDGHGGMLDRLDSLCLSAPAFFYLVR